MTDSFATEIKAYTKTDSFKLLSKLDEFTEFETSKGETIIEYLAMFCDAMLSFEKKAIAKWDPKSTSKTLTYWLPKHADLPDFEVATFLVTLNSFIVFLGEEKRIASSSALLMEVAKAGPLMLTRSGDHKFWSPKKRAQAEEFIDFMDDTFEDILAGGRSFDDFLFGDDLPAFKPTKNPNNVIQLRHTHKPNSPCFCGSGKKFKDCHGDVLPF